MVPQEQLQLPRRHRGQGFRVSANALRGVYKGDEDGSREPLEGGERGHCVPAVYAPCAERVPLLHWVPEHAGDSDQHDILAFLSEGIKSFVLHRDMIHEFETNIFCTQDLATTCRASSFWKRSRWRCSVPTYLDLIFVVNMVSPLRLTLRIAKSHVQYPFSQKSCF